MGRERDEHPPPVLVQMTRLATRPSSSSSRLQTEAAAGHRMPRFPGTRAIHRFPTVPRCLLPGHPSSGKGTAGRPPLSCNDDAEPLAERWVVGFGENQERDGNDDAFGKRGGSEDPPGVSCRSSRRRRRSPWLVPYSRPHAATVALFSLSDRRLAV